MQSTYVVLLLVVQLVSHVCDAYVCVNGSVHLSFVENPYYVLLAIQPKLLLYAVRVSLNPALGTRVTASHPRSPVYVASGGYNGSAFLAFRKTNAGSGHNYMDTDESPVTWLNGVAVVAVVRILEPVAGAIWSMQKLNEHVAFQIHTTVTQGILRLCVSAFNVANNYPSFCTRDAIPLNVWLQVAYTYNRTRSGFVALNVTYVNASVTVALSTGQCCSKVNGIYSNPYSMDMQEFTPNKFVLGYSAVTDCSDSRGYTDAVIRPLDSEGYVLGTDGNPGNGFNCDRPNFDLAGFYHIQTLVSPLQISRIFQAIAAGRQLAYDNSTSGSGGCGCNAGYTGPDGGPCVACADAKYKETMGSSACIGCQANSGVGSTKAVSCVCDLGYQPGV